MKIAPVMFTANKVTNMGQGNMKYTNVYNSCGDDICKRLALASTRDARIEKDLKSMNLIG